MKTLTTVCFAVVVFGFCGIASAQFVGPSVVKVSSVAEVLKSGADGQFVELRGNLLRQLGHEKYEFSDGVGVIRVEIDDEIFPPEKIDNKTSVQIRGEVEKEFLTSIEVDVTSIRRGD
jgi:uncharacterized protein (TIGR00156 family)